MSFNVKTLGCCPECGEAITADLLLIEYESEGRPARFAECPGCRNVVHPSPE
jgi:hypothetical protein